MAADLKVGISVPGEDEAFNEVERKVANGTDFKFQVQRSYSGGMPVPFAQNDELVSDVAANRISVYSFKPGRWSEVDRITSATKTFCEGVDPKAKLRLIVQHEPRNNAVDLEGGKIGENDIQGTSQEYVTLQREIADVVADVNRNRAFANKIRFWGCLEGDAVRAGYADNFWPGDDVWSGIAWDAYLWDRYYPTYWSMKEVFSRSYAYTVAKGLNFGIAETNPGSKYGDKRAPWIREGLTWLRDPDTNCKFVTFWNSSEQFTLTDTQLPAIAYGS